ncbi:hypothetical protein BD626DRAFT_99023 [Schizophyllum amplum]|uniref:Transmembrane protein n=1 Tax=Schizophyllum amplum TaxID=97359 RepID=A0A550CRD5_9AGAR|nr:hypothetical protein BD626DRAFT_99023 [Auriculariopsis ampla]
MFIFTSTFTFTFLCSLTHMFTFIFLCVGLSLRVALLSYASPFTPRASALPFPYLSLPFLSRARRHSPPAPLHHVVPLLSFPFASALLSFPPCVARFLSRRSSFLRASLLSFRTSALLSFPPCVARFLSRRSSLCVRRRSPPFAPLLYTSRPSLSRASNHTLNAEPHAERRTLNHTARSTDT